MDSLIEKMFSQHPFVYEIDGYYYTFGSNACNRCTYYNINEQYKNFEKALEEKNKDDIINYFKKLRTVADSSLYNLNSNGVGTKKDKIDFADFKFSQDEIEHIIKQVERYVFVWQNYITKN